MDLMQNAHRFHLNNFRKMDCFNLWRYRFWENTTIFDAIAFALYDTASGETRKMETLHSDYVEAKKCSEVRLLFSHKGERYQVIRSFNGKRKNEAVLEEEKKEGLIGRKAVNERIREILGLDYQQFKQISMIAQGEFLNLLLAKSEVRSEIFRRVFDTGLYKRLAEVLKSKAVHLREEEKLRKEREHQLMSGLEEELEKNHSGMAHGGFVIRSGKTGMNKEHNHIIEYSLKLDSNPEFTTSVLIAYARAAKRLYDEGQKGCKTVLDIAPAYLSEMSGEELRAHLL